MNQTFHILIIVQFWIFAKKKRRNRNDNDHALDFEDWPEQEFGDNAVSDYPIADTHK